MLVRYPGLTFVGVLAIAVGITISAGAFSILYTLVSPELPVPGGDRVVALQNWDTARQAPDGRAAHDFLTWRAELTSVADLGAFRQFTRNLIASGVPADTVRVAEMSASGFRVVAEAPILGRPLLDEDERPGAAPVLVIGEQDWRDRFGSDPGIIGRIVRLDETVCTIVGVMPASFRFPVRNGFWVPLRLAPSYEPRTGPSLQLFGRLTDGASLESARAELMAIGQRATRLLPKTHAQLRPRVLPYTFPFFDIDDPNAVWLVHLMQLLITLLLVVVCVNVAILVYARTATRQGEIAVRTALGASRRRIIGQLFVEALLLTISAAALGLLLTSAGLRQVNAAMLQLFPQIPFWWHFTVSPGLVAFVGGLALLAALIVGVVPALQATGRRVQLGLQRISGGGGSGMQFGRTWTVLIVAQVAIAVALLPAAVYQGWNAFRYAFADPGFAAHEFITTQLVMYRAGADEKAFLARYARHHEELLRRVASEPGVRAVTFAAHAPGGEATVWIDVEGIATPSGSDELTSGNWVAAGSRAGHQVRLNRVDTRFFEVFDVPVVMGRAFSRADAARGSNAIVVSQSFASRLFGTSSVLGRRLRYVGVSNDTDPAGVTLGRWYEIVGVIGDFPRRMQQGSLARVYHPAAPADVFPAQLLVRLEGGDDTAFTARLRQIGAEVDGNLQLRAISSLDSVLRQEQGVMRLVGTVIGGVTMSVLLLSSAGIYALMSFTVARRRKEIGIRTALGAGHRHILGGIFARAARQLGAGALLGLAIALLLELTTDGALMDGQGIIVLPIVTVLMLTIGMLAVAGPARRGLRVHPTEALREP
jgi:predicted permease